MHPRARRNINVVYTYVGILILPISVQVSVHGAPCDELPLPIRTHFTLIAKSSAPLMELGSAWISMARPLPLRAIARTTSVHSHVGCARRAPIENQTLPARLV